jgi:hypothetical protein
MSTLHAGGFVREAIPGRGPWLSAYHATSFITLLCSLSPTVRKAQIEKEDGERHLSDMNHQVSAFWKCDQEEVS